MTPRPSPSGGSLCALPSVNNGAAPRIITSRSARNTGSPADRGCRHWWWPGRVGHELLPDRAGPPARRARAGRVAESWRTKRWDSLRLIAPNWTLRLPGFVYQGDDPDGFMAKDEVVAFLAAYARSFAAPMREGVRVTAVERDPNGGRLPGPDRGMRRTRRPRSSSRPARCSNRAFRPARRTCLPPWRSSPLPPTGIRRPCHPGRCWSSAAASRAARSPRSCGARDDRCTSRSAAAGGRRAAIGAGISRPGSGSWACSTKPSTTCRPAPGPGRPNPQLTGSDGGRDISAHTLAAEGRGPAGPPPGHRRRNAPPGAGPGRKPGVGRRAGAGLPAGRRRPHPGAGAGRAGGRAARLPAPGGGAGAGHAGGAGPGRGRQSAPSSGPPVTGRIWAGCGCRSWTRMDTRSSGAG